MKKVVFIDSFPMQQDDNKIVNFEFLMKAFWFYGRFSKAMSFSRFALLSQKSQFTYRTFSIVWLPRVKCLLLLCKAEPAWIKRSIHYVILQHYNPGELLKEILPYPGAAPGCLLRGGGGGAKCLAPAARAQKLFLRQPWKGRSAGEGGRGDGLRHICFPRLQIFSSFFLS